MQTYTTTAGDLFAEVKRLDKSRDNPHVAGVLDRLEEIVYLISGTDEGDEVELELTDNEVFYFVSDEFRESLTEVTLF